MTKELLNDIEFVLKETGRMLETDTMNFIEVDREDSDDYVTVTVELVHRKCHKPYRVWDIYIDVVRELVYWDKSRFYNL